MEDSTIRLLVIDDDEDRQNIIKSYLTEEIYSIEFAKNWESGLDRLSNTEFDLVILCNRLENVRNDAVWFFRQLEKSLSDKMEIPLLISIATGADVTEIQRLLKGKRFGFLNKDLIDYVYNLEWAIINFFPRIFNYYKVKIQKSFDNAREAKDIATDLKKNVKSVDNKINTNSKRIDTNKKAFKSLNNKLKTYVRWENIAETLGILVGAFSLAIGIIVTIISIFFNQQITVNDFGISVIPLLVVFALVISSTWLLSYIIYKKRILKKVEDKLREHSDD